MTPFEEGQEARIREAVDKMISAYNLERLKDINFAFTASNQVDREHIVLIGTSILSTKWEIGYPGGSFVQAIVDNNLMETFSRADSINVNCIQFYVYLIYNQGYIA